MTHVLITDYDFLDHSIEQAILDAAGIAFTAAQIRSEDDLIAAARGSDALLLQYAPFSARVAAALPRLGLVSRMGAGFDTIDTDACARHGKPHWRCRSSRPRCRRSRLPGISCACTSTAADRACRWPP